MNAPRSHIISCSQRHVLSNQRGMSSIMIAIVLALTLFTASFLSSILAMKWDDYVLETILSGFKEDIKPDARVKDIRRMLENRLDINDLMFIPKSELNIIKQKGEVSLYWPYERREHVMGNIDIVLSFKHEYKY